MLRRSLKPISGLIGKRPFAERHFTASAKYSSTNFHQSQTAVSAIAAPTADDSSASYLKVLSTALLVTLLAGTVSQSEAETCCKSKNKNKGKSFRRAEVEALNKEGPLTLVTYGDGVYDVTGYLSSHPGGQDYLRSAGGSDLSVFWR
jgi:cytochrome b involved in lipid metabolism